eukprot:8594567-Heterocapsa_arctica.AAC.1
MWKDLMTDEMFWNMLLYSKNEKNQHCYMLKYWPNRRMVLVKTAKGQHADTPKRKWNELDN